MATHEVDKVFGEAALERGFLTEGQLDECLRAAKLVTQAGLDKPLAESDRSRKGPGVYVSPNTKPCGLDEVMRYQDAGVDQVILPLASRDTEDFFRRADALAEELVRPMSG